MTKPDDATPMTDDDRHDAESRGDAHLPHELDRRAFLALSLIHI